MGCWNGTCMISNLPIMTGESVVGYAIEYSSFGYNSGAYSGLCYSNDIARPLGLPFYGKYDDYGGIESIDDSSIAIKYLLHLFEESGLTELIEDIERDKKKIISNMTDKEVGVGLVMINRDIFDRLIASHIPTKYDIKIDEVINGLKDIREFDKKKESLSRVLQKDEEIVMGFAGSPSRLGLIVDILEEKDYRKMIQFVIDQGENDKIAKEFAELLYQNRIIQTMMNKLRKLWIGPSGKGSQSRDYKTHLILAEAIKEHIFKSFDEPEEAYCCLFGDRDY